MKKSPYDMADEIFREHTRPDLSTPNHYNPVAEMYRYALRLEDRIVWLEAQISKYQDAFARPRPATPPESKGLDLEPQRIDQTVLGEKGNCFSACLAMMLGLQLSEVPNFCETPGFDADPGPVFMAAAKDWLAARGWGHTTVEARGRWFNRNFPRGYLMVGGFTSRGFMHSVIYKDCALWHDPHPSREGIQEVIEVDLLYPLNPAVRRLRAGAAGG